MNKDQGLDKNKNDYYIIQHKRRPNMQEETGFIQYSEMFIEKLRFKTIGIIGFGRIGQEVAKRICQLSGV